jgi:hypothetical protein
VIFAALLSFSNVLSKLNCLWRALFCTPEQQHLHTKTKLTKQLDAAKNELNSAVSKLGIVEEERLDGIARMEASQMRVDDLQKLIEIDRKKADDDIQRRVASYHKFEKSIISKHKALNEMMVA